MEVEALLEAVANGSLAPDHAVARLIDGPLSGLDSAEPGVADLGFARVDTHRALRTGDPEVIYGAGKTPEQTIAIVTEMLARGSGSVLITRAPAATLELLSSLDEPAEIHPAAGVALIGTPPEPHGCVIVVCAGTSDLPVAVEAATTVKAFGSMAEVIGDVGVSGLHRVLSVRGRLDDADCLIVVAGMEGALPSVVGGLVGTPIVAVPTSIGYGVATGGRAALLSMLTSCAAGVVVCNIDNGFGAGVHAARVARQSVKR